MDFWSDRNRGDAAMQITLARLLREALPQSRLTIMAAFGANQWPHFCAELDETGALVDEIVGGFYPTFVSFKSTNPVGRHAQRARKALGAVVALLLLPVWAVVARFARLDVFLPGPVRASVAALRSADLVVWNGRNFRADSPAREPWELINLLYNPLVGIIFGKQMACIGASIWPLQNPAARWMLRAVLGHAYFLSLRERASYSEACVLLHGKQTTIEMLPDLSLGLVSDESLQSIAIRQREARIRRVGVTLVDWAQGGEGAQLRYSAAVRELLAHILEDPEARITVIPQVTYEVEATGALVKRILSGLDDERIDVLHGSPTVAELGALYSKIDLLVATRMHSAIFALCQGTMVVTIPYDEGGKWGILSTMGVKDVDVPYSTVSYGALRGKLELVWDRRSEILAELQATLPRLAKDVEQNVSIPLAMYRHANASGLDA